MTLNDLLNAIAKETGLPMTAADSVLRALAHAASAELAREKGEVPLPGLGKLKTEARAARTGRNPQTGEEIQIAAKTVVKFSAAKVLKDALA